VRVVKLLSIVLSIFFLLIPGKNLAIQLGSDSTISVTPSFISIVPYSVFPNTDTDNTLLPFGFFKYGFGLQDASTSCTFNSVFPVTGQVSLHGGKLYLQNDMILQNKTNFATPGRVYGNSHVLEFAQSMTGIPATHATSFDNTALFLQSDITVSGTIKFTGICTIDGDWKGLILGPNANIIIGHNSSLLLKNLDVSQIFGYKISCLDNSGTLILDNVQWGQTGNYTFSSGSILFDNYTYVIGEYTFTYASALTSTINANSIVHFATNSILSIGRAKGFHGQQPLAFVDETSVLKLEDCTVYVTSSGATLTNGSVVVDGEVYLDIQSTTSLGGLYLGNGQLKNDLMLDLSPGSAISLVKGHFINNNVNSQNFFSANINKSFIRQNPNTFFYSNQTLNFANINVINASNGQTILSPGANMYFNNCYLTTPVGDFYITGTRLSANEYLLPGNGNLTISLGLFPLALAVKGVNNSLLGIGDMVGPLILQDGGTQLFVQLGGVIFSNISSAGSSIVLIRDTTLTKDVVITGSANVNLLTNNMTLQVQDGVWTSTIGWSGIGGRVNLTSDLSLASQMTFNGDCTIQGNGNRLNLVSGGNIIVAPNSLLRFKNVIVTGMMGNNIRCNDDSSKITFDTVHGVLNGNYSFTTGSIMFMNSVDFRGPYVWGYQTNITSTIGQNSLLSFDLGLTLSYSPSNQNQNLFKFTAINSVLAFNKNTGLYVGPGGMSLTTGNVIFNSNVSVVVDVAVQSGNPGLTIGDNISNDDFTVDIAAGAVIDLEQGVMTYRNVQSSFWNMFTNSSILRLEAGTQLQLDQTLDLGNGRLQFSRNALLSIAPGKTIIGSTEIF